MAGIALLGETTITKRNQVNLPAKATRRLRWAQGDRLLVEVLGEDMIVLMKRPESFTEAFAGKLTDVFGASEENQRWLAEERRGWEKTL